MIVVSAEAEESLKQWLRDRDNQIEEFRTSGIVAEPLSCHPDMFMCKMGVRSDAEVIRWQRSSSVTLAPVYPEDIAFNAACTGRFFIHNLKHTAAELLNRSGQLGHIPVMVRQGYTKCSTVIVDEDSIITYDRGIAVACKAAGMNVLLITPGHVLLPGYDAGFIGGASGRIGNTVVFNGDLRAHPDFSSMTDFIEARGLDVKWFDGWPLTDIGSIIEFR